MFGGKVSLRVTVNMRTRAMLSVCNHPQASHFEESLARSYVSKKIFRGYKGNRI
jgi:hypothetical protein